ncbi:MAG TPA: glycoside hydrolase family 30 beta sandwich domain-containing protein [Polyangia bacterium]|nr:glycoside hydrolase family 30 beta sandwich domain-containing protein [Polyangia bacterium]
MNKAFAILGLSVGSLALACSSSGNMPIVVGGTGGDTGSGGNTGSGGIVITGNGGNTGSGGIVITGDGGSTGNGGDTGSGGSASGGNTGSGGSVSGNGGNTGSGGSASGGNTGSGGSASGGKGGSASGGNTGSGGATGGSTGTGGTAPAQPLVVTSYGATGASTYWQTGTLSSATGSATVTVNDTGTKQTWEGFGGAFNELGAKYLSMLSQSDQGKALDLLFGADAAHFAIGRIPIGASDYATTRYSEDETAGDTSLAHFSISEDMMYLFPYIKGALGVNSKLRFWASPWTPPTWMKTRTGSAQGTSCGNPTNTQNGQTLSDSNAFDGGCMTAGTNNANFTALANYLKMWATQYGSNGIPIDTISPQNEPSYAQGYPSCLWNPTDYETFVKSYLGPAFSGSSTKIMLGTMSNGDNGQQSHDLVILNDVTGDATAKGFVKVIGLQWGMLDIYTTNNSYITNASGLNFWATEHKCGNYPWNPSGYPAYVEPAPNDQAYGIESWGYISKAIRAGVTSYNAWNMILDTVGKGNDLIRQWSQDSLLVVNTSSKALIVTPAYYVFRHCSQYVQVGAQVLTTNGGDSIAFKNPDGSEVAVMYNSGSASSSYTVAIKGSKYQFSMPSQGWATVFVP